MKTEELKMSVPQGQGFDKIDINIPKTMQCDLCGKSINSHDWDIDEFEKITIQVFKTIIRKYQPMINPEKPIFECINHDICPECFDKISNYIKSSETKNP